MCSIALSIWAIAAIGLFISDSDIFVNRIQILPDVLANQIAAGEVVERPASVIKELVENAIDAGADRIQIEIELGGRRLMRVVDNGSGMFRDDAVLAFERHATSKIRSLDDLGAIATLGFRGEALASIASVAKVELVTKTELDAAGTRLVIEGGRLIDVKDAARDVGTTISVRDLFFNTPARRKFMRSEATENYHLTGIVTHYALAHPEIAFVMTNNGREVIRVAPAKDLRERAYQLFGAATIESLLPVSGGREFVAKVSGFVSAPRERRTTRDSQYFFVNNRYVRDRTIAGGLLEGFRSVLPHGVYPVAFLFVDVPVEEVDVNVHPAKTEIRFRRTEAVKDMIAEAIRQSLASAGIVPEPSIEGDKSRQDAGDPSPLGPPASAQESSEERKSPQDAGVPLSPPAPASSPPSGGDQSRQAPGVPSLRPEAGGPGGEAVSAQPRIDFSDPTPTFDDIAVSAPDSADFEATAGERIETEIEAWAQVDAKSENVTETGSRTLELPPLNSAARLARPSEVADLTPAGIHPIGQLHESYIIAVDDAGLLLIDQHVAHERILFDKFRRKEADRPIQSQSLLLPETIDLSPAQAEAFSLVESELTELGFGLMQLSGRTVAIRSVPTDVPPGEARNLFAELLDGVVLEKRGAAKATIRDNVAASLACKAAVKVNMKLTHEKMQWLIDRLLRTSSPTTCPHGRPVILRLTMRDIERGFHRT